MKKLFAIVCCVFFFIPVLTSGTREMRYADVIEENADIEQTTEAFVFGFASKIEGGIEHIRVTVIGFLIIRQGSDIFVFKGGDELVLFEFDGRIITVLNINLVIGSCADWAGPGY